MSLVNMKEMLIKAKKEQYAVGAFEFWSYDAARAVIEAAEKQKMPVILQVGEYEIAFAGGLKNVYKFYEMAAKESSVPVALHLDHSVNLIEVYEAMDAGFTSVMIDSSAKPFAENVKDAYEVVKRAEKYNVSVEAELGKLCGNEGNINVSEQEASQTDPDEAKRFVDETGIDCLAVSIGTAHGFYTFTPKINIARLKLINEKVGVPLVLHGGSGTPNDDVIESVKNGICKINICTEFIFAYGTAYAQAQKAADFKYNVPSVFEYGKAQGSKLAYDKIKLFSLR